MPQKGIIFRAVIASPGDCGEERRIIPEVITAWNAVHSLSTSAVIEPVMWETHSRPAVGDRPQSIINRQLIDHCDLLIGAFWTRLGTPTGDAESGTAEEIERFRVAEKPVLLYFSSAPVVLDSVDLEQYKSLRAYQDRLKEVSLYQKYDSAADFRENLQRHLASEMIELLKEIEPEAARAAAEKDAAVIQNQAAKSFLSDYETFLRKLEVEWTTERDSEPYNTDDGKYILSSALAEAVHFRSMITEDKIGLTTVLEEAIKRIRKLQRHESYLDGGESFAMFWKEGDAILEQLKTVPTQVSQFLERQAESKPAHGRNETQVAILQVLSPDHATSVKEIARRLNIGANAALFHLVELSGEYFVYSSNYTGDPDWDTGKSPTESTWIIRQPGLAFLASAGLLK